MASGAADYVTGDPCSAVTSDRAPLTVLLPDLPMGGLKQIIPKLFWGPCRFLRTGSPRGVDGELHQRKAGEQLRSPASLIPLWGVWAKSSRNYFAVRVDLSDPLAGGYVAGERLGREFVVSSFALLPP
jgi:hypothetical protein